ncbi:DNRLRE domain-containing protein [Acetanaerobacterium elongatum]|uniref:DNRLRE domain-containing protein n=1 Tax=Acetanaerobacterium elongatum TaxID=258515 RepID=A0A1G9TYG1_9FIRM|nr:DNRLRE domain-containing protein [Acetanaerobacterium elongatum]SDM52706.1 hypothetical protein SAMN05192585_10121 [Acetanaerobacterium elongatum]
MVSTIVHTCETTYLSLAQPNQNYCSETNLTIDNRPLVNSRYSSLIKFALPAAPVGMILLQATLSLYVTQTGISLPCNGRAILVYNNLADFSADTVTWSTRPSTEASAVDSVELCASSVGQYIACDITDLAKAWFSGTSNYGITLDTPEQTANNPILADSANSTHPPLLTLIYQDIPQYKGTAVPFTDSKRYQLIGTSAQLFTTSVDLSATLNCSFIIQNLGSQPFTALLQLSPDKLIFLNDEQRLIVQPSTVVMLCPYRFARYVRLMIDNSAHINVNSTIWIQTQNLNFSFNYQS